MGCMYNMETGQLRSEGGADGAAWLKLDGVNWLVFKGLQ